MAGSLNKVMLIGNLGKDPELKVFEGGNSLARFPIATSESYTNREGQKVELTEWHTIILRRGLAEVADKYLKKGDKVFIEGKIRTRSWKDSSGEQKYVTEIQADNMTMLGGSRDSGGGATNQGSAQNQPAASTADRPDLRATDEDDDLPF